MRVFLKLAVKGLNPAFHLYNFYIIWDTSNHRTQKHFETVGIIWAISGLHMISLLRMHGKG